MAKIIALFIGAFVFFGFMKFVISEQLNMNEKDLQTADDVSENQNIERTTIETIKTGQNYPSKQIDLPITSPARKQLDLMECYVCTDCPNVLLNTSVKVCPYTLDATKQGCVAYAEQYRYMKKSWYIRGCASERGSCYDIRKAHADHADIVSLVYCSECNGDRCNDASRSISDFTMAFFAMVVTPLLAKYTLS